MSASSIRSSSRRSPGCPTARYIASWTRRFTAGARMACSRAWKVGIERRQAKTGRRPRTLQTRPPNEGAKLMASHAIRDRVAVVGMGCTPFGEHWARSIDDLLIDAVGECLASVPAICGEDVDAYWLGTMGSGT